MGFRKLVVALFWQLDVIGIILLMYVLLISCARLTWLIRYLAALYSLSFWYHSPSADQTAANGGPLTLSPC